MITGTSIQRALVLAACLAVAPLARAESPAPSPAPVPFTIQPVKGPAEVALGERLGRLDVPAGYLFLAHEDAIRVLKRAGNPTDGTEIGLLHPAPGTASKAFIVIDYEPIGHVADSSKLDIEALLASIADAQAQQNEARRGRNQPEIRVMGWQEPPLYDRLTKRASWSVRARVGTAELINARVRLLGREGYLSFNLITDPASYPHDRGVMGEVVEHASFLAGQRFEDFVAGHDRDSGKTLADLVVGAPRAAAAGPGWERFREPAMLGLKIAGAIACAFVVLFARFRKRRARAPGSNV